MCKVPNSGIRSRADLAAECPRSSEAITRWARRASAPGTNAPRRTSVPYTASLLKIVLIVAEEPTSSAVYCRGLGPGHSMPALEPCEPIRIIRERLRQHLERHVPVARGVTGSTPVPGIAVYPRSMNGGRCSGDRWPCRQSMNPVAGSGSGPQGQRPTRRGNSRSPTRRFPGRGRMNPAMPPAVAN